MEIFKMNSAGNKQVSLLKKSIDDLKKEINPFCDTWITENKANKEDVIFLLNVFSDALEENSTIYKDDIDAVSLEDFTYAKAFLTEQWEKTGELIIPEKFNLFNPFSNKWKRKNKFEDQDILEVMLSTIETIEN
jgi:hypothetical protein